MPLDADDRPTESPADALEGVAEDFPTPTDGPGAESPTEPADDAAIEREAGREPATEGDE